MEITFAVHAPDAETFWASWITAGIALSPHVYAPGYTDHIEVRDWGSGTITTTTIVDGEPVTVTKPGWFCNCRVTGSLVAEMVQGLAQTDENGNLLSVFDRTWAPQIFSLTEQPADPESGFPAGYRNSTGIHYADMKDIATPYEVRQ
jgi:hypothetical protein